MTDMGTATAAYFDRCAKANANERGADHDMILDQVAREHGVPFEALSEATLDAQFKRAG